MWRNLLKWLLPLALLGGAAAGFVWWKRQPKPLPAIDVASVEEGLPREVAELLSAHGALRGLRPVPTAPVFVVLRSQGRKLAQGWFEGGDAQAAVLFGVADLVREKPELAAQVDVVELCLPHSDRRREAQGKGRHHRQHPPRRARPLVAPRKPRAAHVSHGDAGTKCALRDIEGAFRKQAGLSYGRVRGGGRSA